MYDARHWDAAKEHSELLSVVATCDVNGGAGTGTMGCVVWVGPVERTGFKVEPKGWADGFAYREETRISEANSSIVARILLRVVTQ